MNLAQQVDSTLAGWPLFHQDERILEVEQQGNRLACTLVALDSLACAFTSLVPRSDRLAGSSIERLKTVAGNLAGRLTYLLEPISPIETDVDRCMVQLRSTPPKKQLDQVDYYELLVTRSGELSLARYSRAKAAHARPSPPTSRAKFWCAWWAISPQRRADWRAAWMLYLKRFRSLLIRQRPCIRRAVEDEAQDRMARQK